MAITIKRTTNLDGMILPETMGGLMYIGENQAHEFVISCTKAGEAVALAGTISGRFLRADNATVLLSGSITDGVATIALPASCYVAPGRFIMAIFSTANGTTTTIYSATGNVINPSSDTIVDPGEVIPSIEELLAEIENMQTATAAANAAAASANAAANNALSNFAGAFDAATAYPAGTYVTYTDGYMYLLPNGHEADVTWANTTKTKVTTGIEIKRINDIIGNESFPTTAQTITGAIAEVANGAVRCDIAQSLTSSEQIQARNNIGAANGAEQMILVQNYGKCLRFTEQTLTESQKTQARTNIGAAASSDVSLDEKYALLLHDEIPGTTQTIAFDASGNVSTITHTNGSSTAVRTDAFTFAAGSITEVRTLNTGETLTIVTNTTTLATTVTYTAAA